MVGYGGKDWQKRKVLSPEWKSEGVMDDESGESMEPMEEVPLVQLGEASTKRYKTLYLNVSGSALTLQIDIDCQMADVHF